jgi:hypothetical protein
LVKGERECPKNDLQFGAILIYESWGTAFTNSVNPGNPQGINAIPSEYTCLKKIVTPSDHDLYKIARISQVNDYIYLTVQHTVDLRHVNRQRRKPRHAQFPSPRCASPHQHCGSSVRPSPHRSLLQREDGIAPARKGFRLRVPTVFGERRKTAARLSASEEPEQT